MTQDNEIQEMMRKIAKEGIIPKIGETLQSKLEIKLNETRSDELIVFLTNLGNFYEDLQKGIVYSPYKTVSSCGMGYITRASAQLPNVSNQIKVEYRRDYQTFGEAIWDFVEQTELPVANIAKVIGVSTKTFYRIREGKLGRMYRGAKRNYYGPTSPNAVRDRLTNVWDINPPEKRLELDKLPMSKPRIKNTL